MRLHRAPALHIDGSGACTRKVMDMDEGASHVREVRYCMIHIERWDKKGEIRRVLKSECGCVPLDMV